MTLLAVVKERSGESRVALTPEAAGKLKARGLAIAVEAGAGETAAIPDGQFVAAGAEIEADGAALLARADLVLSVRGPGADRAPAMRTGSVLVGLINPFGDKDQTDALARAGVTAFALEFVPRITRAQVMDALSSQANLAGYRAVIEAAEAYGRAMPMMMTPAGTVAPAKVFVMGAGVAGLQAIATARRLGAVVTATDVRPAAKEQVESLGAKFVAVEDEEFRAAETAAGYAKEMSEAYREKQAALVSEHLKRQDIVITTALVPGRTAPRLVSAAQLATMRPGSVVIDMAVEQGGNVEGSGSGGARRAGDVTVLGFADLPGRIAADASALLARNLSAFIGLLLNDDGALRTDYSDEILAASLVTQGGAVVHPQLKAA